MSTYFSQSSDRLDMRAMSWDDLEEWSQFFEGNPNLHFLGIFPEEGETSLGLSKKWIEKQLKRYEDTNYGHLALIDRESGELIGNSGILVKEIDGEIRHEIGYSIMPKHWRKGYATEVAQHLKQYMIDHQVAPKAISIIHIDNIGSQKVARKNGMDILEEAEHLGMPVYIFGTTLY